MPRNNPGAYAVTSVNSSGKGMKRPKKGKKPVKITTKNPPGGPHTPGAKDLARRLAERRRK